MKGSGGPRWDNGPSSKDTVSSYHDWKGEIYNKVSFSDHTNGWGHHCFLLKKLKDKRRETNVQKWIISNDHLTLKALIHHWEK